MTGKYLNKSKKARTNVFHTINQNLLSAIKKAVIGLLIAAVIFLNLFTHVLQIVRYNGKGMEPSIQDGQTLVLLKTDDVTSGDIIAFYYNNQVLIRRVIGEAGDQITIENDGTVYVDGQVLEEPYVSVPSIGQNNISFPLSVQSGYVFVMGDNRVMSMDSRLTEIGPIPLERVIGKVVIIF